LRDLVTRHDGRIFIGLESDFDSISVKAKNQYVEMMILLVGLPGSGKTTVAKRLANLLLPAQNVQAVYQQPNAKPTEQQPKIKPIALAPSSKRPREGPQRCPR
jgi:ABC-type glutathione transport system ATPase component